MARLPTQPQFSVIVATYRRPEHLRRSLLSLAMQRGVEGQFELVVTDDGSTDETPEVVAEFARSVPFSVQFVTQQHKGFRAARVRNNGVRFSTAPYLVFVDSDCVLAPNHLRQHMRARRPGVARSGDSYRLDEATTRLIDEQAIATGAFRNWVPTNERWRLLHKWIKDGCYSALQHSDKPRILAGNLALWRSDFERVNGFDEQFVGWGCEDDDLNHRLRQAGIRVASILGYTRAYHLWHPPVPTQPVDWANGPNVGYLHRPGKPARCAVGLDADYSADDDTVQVTVLGDQSASRPGEAA